MTKKEIVKQISERAQLTQLKTKEIVQWTFDAIVDTLIQEGRIELRNFGVFEVKRRKPRKARNPRTGAKVEVEAKNVVTFQPGKEMELRVKQMSVVPDRPTKTRKPRSSPPPAATPQPEAPPAAAVNNFAPAGGDSAPMGRNLAPSLTGSASG
jgi:integration host factor subunit beta